MSEWKEQELSELAELRKDSWKVGDEQLPYIALEHIVENGLRLEGIGNSSIVASNKYYFDSQNFLFGKLRPYFRKLYRPNFKGICSTDIWVVKPKDGNDKDFLFYFFANKEFIDYSYSGSSGTRMPRADWNFVSKTKWRFPEPIEQRAISSILSSLDDKIDLLHRQNHTLEQMAETLFRQWFPPVGGQGVEEADDSWEIGTLNDVLTVKGGTTPSTKNPDYWDGDIHWTSPRDITTLNSIYLFDTERKITEAGLKKISSGLLPKGTLLMSSRAPVGVLAFAEVPIAINQGYIAILDDKGLSKEFLFLWLKTNMDYVQSYANGSTFLEISKSAFKSLGIQIPPKDLRNEFQEWVTPHFKKIKSNQTQIRTLTALRDTLLPKLMSGEIRLIYDSDDFGDSCDSNNQINQTNQKNHSSDK
jgi:type I restriction enzyme S subunit